MAAKVLCRQGIRRLQWVAQRQEFATDRTGDEAQFPVLLFRHTSVLVRDPERAEQDLQQGKINNLRIAAAALDRVVLPPARILSFWHLVGRPTARKGYAPGLELYKGRLVASVGGGLCQLSNLLYWMALHVNLEVAEWHRHDRDLFPDKNRKVPFGAGATVFYNYLDLRIRNSLEQPILLRIGVGEKELWGEFRGTTELGFRVRIEERDHRFFGRDGRVFRENRLWRRITDAEGKAISDEELAHNLCEVMYPLTL